LQYLPFREIDVIHENSSFVVTLVVMGLLLSGCSVGMAMSGKHSPNLGMVRVGSTRGEVELQLGPPVTTTVNPNGNRTDLYEYEVGNDPSAGRAIGHGVMDVLTLGIWEVVGTPIEGFQGDKYRMAVVYNEEDKVTSINQAPMPSKQTQNTSPTDLPKDGGSEH
jgi:hypothetical protein